MTKKREPKPRPQIRCAICGRGHNKARTAYCGNPCSPRVAAIVTLIAERPRGIAEIIRDLPQYTLREGRIKQIIGSLGGAQSHLQDPRGHARSNGLPQTPSRRPSRGAGTSPL
jgi:hypothetical protein